MICRPYTFYLFHCVAGLRRIKFNIGLVAEEVTNKPLIAKMSGSKIPSPYMTPEEIAKIPLPPAPTPFLTSYITQREIKTEDSTSTIYSSFDGTEENKLISSSQRNEQCYELQRKDKTLENLQKCYEVSSENNFSLGNIKLHYSAVLLDDIKNETATEQTYDELKSEEHASILKSTENFHYNYLEHEEIQNLQNKQIDNDEVFASPVHKQHDEIKINPIAASKSLKRSHSLCDDDDSSIADHKFTPKRTRDSSYRYFASPLPQKLPFSFHSRQSLPANSAFLLPFIEESSNSTPDKFVRRKSFPFEKLPNLSPSPLDGGTRYKSRYRSCVTDQTPYSEDDRRKRIKTLLPYYNAYDLICLKSESGFIDSHCHLDFLFQRQGFSGTFTEFKRKHEDTFPQSYAGCLAVFCNPFTFNQEYMWGKFLKEENIWASFGCHPHNAKDYNDEVEKSLCAALKHSKVRALGEIGLDYSNRNNCLKDKQFSAFRRQLKIALTEKLPVVIHCREAHEDGMSIIKEILPEDYTIHLHCFTDTWEWAQKWLDKFPNLFIGITNVVTFPSAESVHEVAKNIPLSRLLLETDAPYFVPRRVTKGTRFSHPGMAIHVAAQIAALREVPLEEVLQHTRENTKRVYNI